MCVDRRAGNPSTSGDSGDRGSCDAGTRHHLPRGEEQYIKFRVPGLHSDPGGGQPSDRAAQRQGLTSSGLLPPTQAEHPIRVERLAHRSVEHRPEICRDRDGSPRTRSGGIARANTHRPEPCIDIGNDYFGQHVAAGGQRDDKGADPLRNGVETFRHHRVGITDRWIRHADRALETAKHDAAQATVPHLDEQFIGVLEAAVDRTGAQARLLRNPARREPVDPEPVENDHCGIEDPLVVQRDAIASGSGATHGFELCQTGGPQSRRRAAVHLSVTDGGHTSVP
ncbi:unannotated protein [freshwater metagenome]|uniref:Unannotated protein n=1 Tax=freshwater metagenome TaxID=449393 RepID=A0A6J6ZLU0_9ZZZZ